MGSRAVASGPKICVSRRNASTSPASVQLMTRITEPEAGAPTSLAPAGALFASRAESHRFIHDSAHSFYRSDNTNPLEHPLASCIVALCFRTRKRDEAWNPGNFGCRGLLVYGPRKIAIGARFCQFANTSAARRLAVLIRGVRPSRGVTHEVAPRSAHSFRDVHVDSGWTQPRPRLRCLCASETSVKEAWNPGNFGCRGLLVSGPQKF